MGKQIINGDVEITGQLLKGDLKALYHLGAYDSVDTSSANYDLVTRNGYYFDENSQWTYYADPNVYVISIAGVSSDTSNVVCNKSFAYRYSWDGTDSHWYFENGKYYLIVIPSDLQGIVIQAKNPSSYTEKVLKNQPLSTLDQNGENWLRGEYEKQLNLLPPVRNITPSGCSYTRTNGNEYTISVSNNSDPYISFRDAFAIEPNQTITFSTNASHALEEIYVLNGDTVLTSAQSDKVTYTNTTGSRITIRFNIDFVPNEAHTLTLKLAVHNGTIAYPYTDYNGPIMHAIDVEGVLLWKNGNPYAEFTARGSSNPITLADSLASYKYIVVVMGFTYYQVVGDQLFKFVARVNTDNVIGWCKQSTGESVWCSMQIVNNTKVYFSDTKGPSGNTANSYLTPRAIYGVNGL